MKQNGRNQTQIDDNLIDEVIRMSYGFSDEQLRAELEDAKAHSDDFPELKIPDDEFEKILQKMEERGIKPLPLRGETEKDSDMSKKEEGAASEMDTEAAHEKIMVTGRKRIALRRMWKVLLAAAVLAAMGVGFSLNAVGKGATKYRVVNGEKNNIVWNNVQAEDGIDDIKEAYKKIEEILNIPSLKMGYIPDGMIFEKLVFSDNIATIRFNYQGSYLHIYQWKLQNGNNGMHEEERNDKISEVYNPWIKREVNIYEEVSKNGDKKYGTSIENDDIRYYINGAIEKEEFKKIAESLYMDK